MRFPRLLLFTLAVSLTVAGVATPAPHTPARTALENSVDEYLAPLIRCDVFQGVVLVARGDRVLLEKGFGDANLELGVRNTPDKVFRIASLSKPFTEVLLGRLVEQRRLDLSDPVSRFLPDFPNGDRITLELLRNHRAGIPNMNSIPFDEESRQPNTLDSLVRAIARQPLDFEPGSKRSYSNGGYAVLAAVIERVTGTSYAECLEREVLRPMGLLHTRHEADGMLVRDRAYGYVPGARERHGLVPAPFQQMATKTGGGSLVSTAGDLHRFLRAAYRDGVIRATTWRMLFPPDDSVFSYQGRCPGYNLFMMRDLAHDIDVVVLSNNYASGMVADVGHDLIAIARGEHVARPPYQADAAVDSAKARDYAGTFHATGALPYGQGPFGVSWGHGGLVFSIQGAPVDFLLPQAPGVFLLRNLWSELRFASVPESTTPRATLRPLWFKTEPVALERTGAATP